MMPETLACLLSRSCSALLCPAMLKPLHFDGQILIRVQEMAVGIIGLCLGMFFAHAVAGSSSGGFALYVLLTMAHLACNYKVAAPAVHSWNR